MEWENTRLFLESGEYIVIKGKNAIDELESMNKYEKYTEDFFRKRKGEPKLISLKISAVYLLIGAVWILLSDKMVDIYVNNKVTVTYISLIKGWVYVAATGILLFNLIYSALKRIKSTENELVKSYQELTEKNKELESAYGQLTASEDVLRQQYDEIVESQKKHIESEERYRLITEATNDAIWEEKEGIRKFSDRWFEITGYTKEELEEAGNWEALVHPEDKLAADNILCEHIRNKTPYYQCEYRLRIKNGEYKWIQSRGKAIFGEDGKACRMAGSHTDITELKQYEQKLRYLAYYDQLTALGNRLSMIEKFNNLLTEGNGNISLLYIDVDNFKYVNDTIGHSYGDLLLVKISERLSRFQEDSCNVYRISGDEFIILYDSFENDGDIEKLAVRILKGFKESFEIGNSNLYITISMGISVYGDHGVSMDELLKNADIAVYKAKELGRNRIIIYNEPMNEVVTERMIIEKQLRTALENNEFELYYQPQLDILTNKISGFEALIRWRNSELGFVLPSRFISIAEDTHLIIPIGEWVLRNACMFFKRISQYGNTDMTISINVSILQLLQDDFVDMVMEIIDLVGMNPKQLEIEITESILMESYETIACKLKLLRLRGISIALDDFGKGYSSLNYLRQLPISTLKIDKSFIDTISLDKKNKSLTDLIVKLGRSMDLCVIAEGVETQEQMNYLIKHKCNKIQGYLFSKPLSEKEVLQVVENQE